MNWLKLSLLLLAVSVSGCATRDSLYESLGGKPGLERIAARFIANIGEDETIREYFEHSNLDRFYEMFSLHLCSVVEGPCEYMGDEMVATHVGMQITEADFNRVVDLLIDAMEEEGIPHPVQNKLLAKLAPLRSDIIYR